MLSGQSKETTTVNSVVVLYIMVTRIINGIEIDIEETSSNEMYFTQDFIDSIKDFDGRMDQIKDGVYSCGVKEEYMPLSITWELTNSCNFSCPFCYINTPCAKRYPFYSYDELTKMVDSLVDMGMLFCTLTGGECLLHPNFADLYCYLKKKGVIVSVFTNGFLINDIIIESFLKYKPYKIEISIYGYSDVGFKKSTNTCFSKDIVFKNILKLKEIGIDVRCKTPITNLTSPEIPLIKKWCDDNDIYYYVSDELFDSYYGENVDDYRTDNIVYQTSIKEKENSYVRNSNRIFGRKKAWECSAGKYSGVISADRFFSPCMSSVGVEKYKFSISNGIATAIADFKRILAKEQNKNLDFCQGCIFCDICEKCVLSLITDSHQHLSEHCRNMERFK